MLHSSMRNWLHIILWTSCNPTFWLHGEPLDNPRRCKYAYVCMFKKQCFCFFMKFCDLATKKEGLQILQRIFLGKKMVRNQHNSGREKKSWICHIKKLLLCTLACIQTIILFLCNFLPKDFKKSGLVNRIKGKKVFKIRALLKVAELWTGDCNHPSIINEQGASSTLDVTLNPCQTHLFHYS